MSDDYQGWTNHATWCVSLHIGNTERTYKHVRAMAERLARRARTRQQVKDGIWTEDEAKLYTFEDELKEWVDKELTERWNGRASGDKGDFAMLLRLDLLQGYLSLVNWREIAQGIMNEVSPPRPKTKLEQYD